MENPIGKVFLIGLKKTMLGLESNISEKDLDLINLVNTTDQAVRVVDDFYKKYKNDKHELNF